MFYRAVATLRASGDVVTLYVARRSTPYEGRSRATASTSNVSIANCLQLYYIHDCNARLQVNQQDE